MPLQRVPPREALQAPSDHQFSLEHICSHLNQLLLGHTRLDLYSIQMGVLRWDAIAGPLVWVQPVVVCEDVTFQVRDPPVLLFAAAPSNRAPKLGQFVDRSGCIFGLEIAECDRSFVRVRTPGRAGRSSAPPEFGGRSMSGGGGTGDGLCLGANLTLLLLGGRRFWGKVVFVVIGGRNVVGIPFTVGFETIAA